MFFNTCKTYAKNMNNKAKSRNGDQLSIKKKGLAILSLILAVGWFSSTASIAAVICGHLALHKIKKNPSKYAGKRFAISGLIVGYLGLIVGFIIGIMKGVVTNKLGH